MSLTRDNFSRRYAVRLQEYLAYGSRTVLRRAVSLGRQAVQLGLETLELARIHHGALGSLGANTEAAGPQRRAQSFFNQVQTSLVERQPAVTQVQLEVEKLESRLKVRSGQLADAQLQLQSGILQRRSLEVRLRKAGRQFTRLQLTSARAEASLRHLAHELILAHEEQRRRVRGQLQNEIGQTLLGIGIELLNLKRALAENEGNFLNGIATAEGLVVKCLKPENSSRSS
jgi:hypothetical protein